MTGADNGGYVSYWDWAPPIPNRPWGRAMMTLLDGNPRVPVGPGISPNASGEVRGTQRQFTDYIARQDITSLQPYRAMQRHPQWQTVDADLVLLGTPKDNLLLLDQARGGLLPDEGLTVTYSPFVGGRWVLNLAGGDLVRLESVVR